MSATARLERDGGLGRLILDRPPVNVLDIAALETLAACLRDVMHDPAVRVLTVTGAGKAFCAGVDVADHVPERVGPMLDAFHRVIGLLMEMQIPVVALVHGAALGGGCELALACDVVLVRADAKLGQPEIRLAVFPPVSAALLPRMVGRQRALDLILSGRTLTGEEAVRLGLAAHAWPADDFAGKSDAYVRDLLALSGPALRVAKRAVDAGLDLPFAGALAAADRIYRDDLIRLDDTREGLAAFLEKRAPAWKGA